MDDDGSDEDDVDDLLMMESAFPVRRGVWQICTCASRGEIVPLYRWHKDIIFTYVYMLSLYIKHIYIERERKDVHEVVISRHAAGGKMKIFPTKIPFGIRTSFWGFGASESWCWTAATQAKRKRFPWFVRFSGGGLTR